LVPLGESVEQRVREWRFRASCCRGGMDRDGGGYALGEVSAKELPRVTSPPPRRLAPTPSHGTNCRPWPHQFTMNIGCAGHPVHGRYSKRWSAHPRRALGLPEGGRLEGDGSARRRDARQARHVEAHRHGRARDRPTAGTLPGLRRVCASIVFDPSERRLPLQTLGALPRLSSGPGALYGTKVP
jgi:hypothetical protein